MASPLLTPSKSPAREKQVVPWKSRQEFLQVYSDLFSENEDRQIKAINRIETWKSRAGQKISVAVDNTNAVLESIIKHRKAARDGLLHEKDSELRSGYGLAIVRFVNHVTERGQDKEFAKPINAVAKEFGIPEWIVDIRHDATHNALPRLDILEKAANWALLYFKEQFWDNQTHEVTKRKQKYKLHKSASYRRVIKESLVNLRKRRLKDINGVDINEEATNALIQQVKTEMAENMYCVVECLLQDGFLIPTADQLVTDFHCSEEDVILQPIPSLPKPLAQTWAPVMDMVVATNAAPVLAKLAVFSLSEEDNLRNHLLTAWLDRLFSYHTSSKKEKSARVKAQMLKSLNSVRKVLLAVCLEKVSKFTMHLLQYLLDKEELGASAFSKLSELLNLTQPGNDADDSGSMEGDQVKQESIYSVQDVKDASFISDSQPGVKNTSSSSDPEPTSVPALKDAHTIDDAIDWKICTEAVDWSKIPFGLLPAHFEGQGDSQDRESEEEKDRQGSTDDDSNDDNNEDEDGTRSRRDWKRLERKRPHEKNSDPIPAKNLLQAVNDTELL